MRHVPLSQMSQIVSPPVTYHIWCSHLFSGPNMNNVLVLMMGFFFREGRRRLPNRPPVFRIFMKFLRLTGWSSSSNKRQTTMHNCTICYQIFSPLRNMKKAPNESFTDSSALLQQTYTCRDATKNALRYITQHSVTLRCDALTLYWEARDAVAQWLARCSQDWAVWVLVLAGDIVLCSWARHFTLTVPLSTQVYKWVPANLMLGVTLRWTSIPSRGEKKFLPVAPCYRNRVKLQLYELLTWRRLTLILTLRTYLHHPLPFPCLH